MPIKKLVGFKVSWTVSEKTKQRSFESKEEADLFAAALPDATITKFDDGYEVRYDTYDTAGVRKQHRRRFDKQADAKNWLAKQQLSEVDESNQTVKECLDAWLLHVKQRRKPKTYQGYKYDIEHYFLPRFDGRMKISKVRSTHIQKALDKLIEEGKSATTVSLVRRTLHAALARLVGEEIAANPINRTEGGGKPARQHTAIDAEQAEKLLEAVRGTMAHTPIFLAVTLGLCRAEVMGLKWEDIDLQAQTMNINRNRQYIHKQGMQDDTPKTEQRRRALDLPKFVVEELQRERKRQIEDQMLSGEAYQKTDYVCRKRTGAAISPNCIAAGMKAGREKAKLPYITFHDLRHSCASVLIAHSIPITTVSAMLGHSSTHITTKVYAHALQSGKKDAAAELDKIYGKK